MNDYSNILNDYTDGDLLDLLLNEWIGDAEDIRRELVKRKMAAGYNNAADYVIDVLKDTKKISGS